MIAAFTRAVLLASCAVCAYAASSMALVRVEAMRSRLAPVSLDEVLRDRTLSFMLFAALGLVLAFASSLWLLPIALLGAHVLSAKAPQFVEARKKRELKAACEGELDVLADTVSMAVRAGLNFDAALDLYCAKFSGPLAREMEAAHTSWKTGIASREQALSAVSRQVDSPMLARFADTVVQAVEFGAPLAQTLSNLAREIRQNRRASVERQVEKAPVKMLVPMGTCILPAMLILVMGPVLLQFLTSSM